MASPELADDPRYHQCSLLKYDNRYLDLVHPGTEHQRWVLRSMKRAEPSDEHDVVLLQLVMFCPFCGFDGRNDARWRVCGRPEFNELVAKAQRTAGKGPMATAAERRPENFNSLCSEKRWEIDKRLGILDWDGTPET